MRILYDGSCFAQAYGGVSRYYCEMMRRLPVECEVLLPLKETVNCFLQERPFEIPMMDSSVHHFVKRYFNGWYMPGVSYLHRMLSVLLPRFFKSGEMTNLCYLNELVERNEFDVYHVTGPNHYNSVWRKVKGRKPIVVTVHDLIFDRIFNDKRVISGRRELLAAADAIIAVSEHTKKDIVGFYGIAPEKISVVYHGSTFGVAEPVCDDKYILYVGARREYKNWKWFVRAIAPLMADFDLRLVCTGSPFDRHELALLNSLGISDRTSARFVADVEMHGLFGHATAFVYPSQYEGFGLPILDAWASGCPVVLSRASCFPEIARDAALYYDLGDEKGLRDAVQCVRGDNRGVYAQKGYAELSRFSWEKCATETAKVYESVV